MWLSLMTLMAEEAERAAQGVADHRRADMADVHRLGHVGGGIVDDVGPRLRGRRDAQPRIVHRGRQLPHEPVVFQPQVDETRAGHFRRLAQIGHVEPGNDLGGQFPRLLAQLLAQGHGEVRLVVAEAGVLARRIISSHGSGRSVKRPGPGEIAIEDGEAEAWAQAMETAGAAK